MTVRQLLCFLDFHTFYTVHWKNGGQSEYCRYCDRLKEQW